MALTASEVNQALEEYQQRFWDEDHPDYDEEKDDEGINNVWSEFTYDSDLSSVDIPGVGVMEKVKVGTELTTWNEKVLYVIVKIGDQFFKMEGWSDSWSGEEGWEGPLYEVVQKEVVTTVWEKKNDD